jgi:hypothetical protein
MSAVCKLCRNWQGQADRATCEVVPDSCSLVLGNDVWV